MRKYFGTDGIRGEVGKPPVTTDFILKLGWAAGRVLAGGKRGKVVIGKDTRISGYMFESALEAGLTAAGVDAVLLGPMPTPAVAYLTRTLRATAGIVISASHNPYSDNGVKFFTEGGGKLSDDAELAIEAAIDSPMQTVRSTDIGKAVRIDDAAGRYIEFCKSTVPPDLTLQGLRIVVDCAHGATYHIAPSVFSELGAEVVPIGCAPNGLNINDGFGPLAPTALRNAVRERRADLGIAFDGDGDRVMMVDAEGEIVDGDELLFVIAEHRHAGGLLTGSVVGTVMTNRGLEVALESLGVDMHRARVGDRYVMELMREHGSLIGGESSGHIICPRSHHHRRWHRVGSSSAPRSGAFRPSARRSEAGHVEVPADVAQHPARKTDQSRFERNAQRCSRGCGRESRYRWTGSAAVVSGTEPMVRIMVEGTSRTEVEKHADRLAEAVSAMTFTER